MQSSVILTWQKPQSSPSSCRARQEEQEETPAHRPTEPDTAEGVIDKSQIYGIFYKA